MSWGSQTGVRPVKAVRNMLENGLTGEQAAEKFMNMYGASEKKARLCVDIAALQQCILSNINENDICVYIGIPFCRTRCLYCSFITAETCTANNLTNDFVE